MQLLASLLSNTSTSAQKPHKTQFLNLALGMRNYATCRERIEKSHKPLALDLADPARPAGPAPLSERAAGAAGAAALVVAQQLLAHVDALGLGHVDQALPVAPAARHYQADLMSVRSPLQPGIANMGTAHTHLNACASLGPLPHGLRNVL